MPSSSKSTTKTDMGPWGPMQGTILDYGVPELKKSYESAVNNPLIGQASGLMSDTMAGKFMDFSQNQQLKDVMNLYGRRAQTQYETMAARAGRGAMGPDMMRAAMEGIGTAQIAPLFDLYKGERTMQNQAMMGAPDFVNKGMVPAQILTEGLRGYGALGQKGTSTTETKSSNPMGIAMTALGALAAPFTGGASLAM